MNKIASLHLDNPGESRRIVTYSDPLKVELNGNGFDYRASRIAILSAFMQHPLDSVVSVDEAVEQTESLIGSYELEGSRNDVSASAFFDIAKPLTSPFGLHLFSVGKATDVRSRKAVIMYDIFSTESEELIMNQLADESQNVGFYHKNFQKQLAANRRKIEHAITIENIDLAVEQAATIIQSLRKSGNPVTKSGVTVRLARIPEMARFAGIRGEVYDLAMLQVGTDKEATPENNHE
jgi:hypothetical protein